MDKGTLMNGHSVAKTICGTVQWAARQASNPVFKAVEFDQATGTMRVTVENYDTTGTAPEEVYEVVATLVDGMTPRERLVKVAEGFHDLSALQAKQRDTAALMVRACLQRIRSTDSRKRREGIDGLESLALLLEGKAHG